jgi:hypothetical protein
MLGYINNTFKMLIKYKLLLRRQALLWRIGFVSDFETGRSPNIFLMVGET